MMGLDGFSYFLNPNMNAYIYNIIAVSSLQNITNLNSIASGTGPRLCWVTIKMSLECFWERCCIGTDRMLTWL